jgi:hypothetical protein
VLSLYNHDPWSFADPYDGAGYRLLAQSQATPGGDAVLARNLTAGTYWVAVSGAGNRWFHPFLAGSGEPGSVGDYELSLEADDLPDYVNTTPTVIAATPGNGAAVARAPLVVRIDYSAPLDTGAIDLSSTQLIYSPTGDFTDPDAVPIGLASYNFSTDANELQLTPAAPLKPGYYGVFLADGSTTPALQFRVAGVEGGSAGDDSAATANQLGDLTRAGHFQVAGVIGDDPAYDPNNSDPLLGNPASDVDLYHFRVTGPGRYAFVADVFAGRIGSRLDAGVSLFRLGAGGQLDFIDGNDNTLNGSVSDNGQVPLYNDAVLYSGLTAGDYYVAVSSGGNVPERALGRLPGEGGIFDPNSPHNGTNGGTVGPYVLNLGLVADNTPPAVVAVTHTPGSTQDGPPVRFTVTFSESVNLELLAYQAFQQTSQATVSPVWVERTDATAPAASPRFYPRLESYDPATHQAVFLMLDGLANGPYALHLSGRPR